MTPFLLGVNYWPRRKAMYFWRDFDLGEVREEFAMIRALSLGYVRLFLLWESFQPASDRIDSRALGNLRAVCDVAAEQGLRLQPTFFTGHMSGPNWAPDWLLKDSPRTAGMRQLTSLDRPRDAGRAMHNIYTEPFVIAAAEFQLREVCRALADHPALWAWSLGNEPDLFCRPPDAASGSQWIARMTQAIRNVDPHHPVVIGLHTTSFFEDCGLRIDHAAAHTDLSVMHAYSIYSPLARVPLDEEWLPFSVALTAALAGRPVLAEEFGVCTHDAPSAYRTFKIWDGSPHRQYYASDDDGAAFYATVLPRLVDAGALGAFAWCFGDYDPALWDRPPCDFVLHERSFGLYRADGTLKATGQAVRDFARTQPTVKAASRGVTLPVSSIDEYYRNPGVHVAPLYRTWCSP